MDLVISADDPSRPAVAAVLEAHLREMHEVTPVGGVFAFDAAALHDPSITVFSASAGGAVVGVAALRRIDDQHVEIKSMHTVAAARGNGVATVLLDHLLAVAADRGAARVSLETGNMDAFVPARTLYARAGFEECPPFGPYVGSTTSTCMTKVLRGA